MAYDPGPLGPIGPTGYTGYTGLTGPYGPIGYQGPTGYTGQDGITGMAGPQGWRGFPGKPLYPVTLQVFKSTVTATIASFTGVTGTIQAYATTGVPLVLDTALVPDTTSPAGLGISAGTNFITVPGGTYYIEAAVNVTSNFFQSLGGTGKCYINLSNASGGGDNINGLLIDAAGTAYMSTYASFANTASYGVWLKFFGQTSNAVTAAPVCPRYSTTSYFYGGYYPSPPQFTYTTSIAFLKIA